MRKHFLILMLMALLPLAGWAEPVEVVDISGYQIFLGTGEATATQGNYNGANALPVVKLVKADNPDITADKVTVAWKNSANEAVAAEDRTEVDTYTVTVTAKDGVSEGELATPTATFTVKKATLNITREGAAVVSKVYGATLADFEAINVATLYDAPAFLEANVVDQPTLTVSVDWGDDFNAGVHPYTMSVNALKNYNVNIVPSSGEFTITKANLTITAEDANVTYGEVFNGGSFVSYEGFVLGEGPSALTGSLTWTTNYKDGTNPDVTPSSAPGPYSWSPKGYTSNNYNITYNDGNINVLAKDIKDLTISNFADKTYNKTDWKPAAIEASYQSRALVATTDYTLTYLKGITEDDVTHEITDGDAAATFTDAATYYVKIVGTGNFEGTVYKSFKVKKAPLGIRAKDLTPAYNATDQKALVLGAAINDIVEFSGLVPASGEGPGAIEADTYPEILLDNEHPITLKLQQNAVDVTEAKEAGDYNIVFTSATDIFKNYDAVYANGSQGGKLKIAKRVLTVNVNDIHKNFGTVDPYKEGIVATKDHITVVNAATADDFFVGGVYDATTNPTAHHFTAYPVIKREGTEAKGDYRLYLVDEDDFVVKAGDTDVTSNYDIQVTDGHFIIDEGVISIFADTKTFTYGQKTVAEARQALTATIVGMTDAEVQQIQALINAKLILNVPEGLKETDWLPANAAGYSITIGDLEGVIPETILANYDNTFNQFDENAKFVVNKKALTKITANTQPLYVGEEAADLAVNENTVTIDGALDGDLDDILEALEGTLQFADHVRLTGDDPKVLDDVPDADIEDEFIKATSTYLKGIEFDLAADLGNYAYPADEENIVAGDLIVTEDGDVLTLDATKANNSTLIDDADDFVAGQKRDVVIKGRTLQANKWNALSLPFDISVRDLSATLGYAIVDRFQQTGDKLSFKIFIGQIPAYTPFLVKVDEAVDMKDITFEDVVVKATETVTEENDTWKFINTVDKGVVDGLVYHITPSKSESAVYLDHKTSPELMGFYAYFKTQTGQPVADARIYIEEPDGSTTAISSINADGVAVKAEGWYTIDGIRLQGAPTEKGVYINNGKKIVVK